MLYNVLRKFAAKKPLVVVMGGMAASGGYMVSLAADHIIAHTGTITGSVGVIMQVPDLSGIAKKLGVGMHTVRSGELKGGPSMFEKLSEKERSSLQDSLCVAYDYFQSLVLDRRKVTEADLKKISTGKIFIGKQALEVSLVDQIGDEDDAVKWLEQNNVIAKIKDVKISSEKSRLPFSVNSLDWKKTLIKHYLKNYGVLAVLPSYFAGMDLLSSLSE